MIAMLLVVLINLPAETRQTPFPNAKFGTLCKVFNTENDKCDIYIQFSIEEDKPDWQFMATLDNEELDDYSEDMIDQLFE